jgi:hypothetical protein
MMTLHELFLGLMITVFCCGSIAAQKTLGWQYDLSERATKNSKVTYADLVKKVFPDLHSGEATTYIASKSISLRHLFGLYTNKVYENEMKVGVSDGIETINGNEKLLWLIISATEPNPSRPYFNIHLLAVYRIKANEAEMIDVADVLTGSIVNFFDKRPAMEISPRHQAVVIEDFANRAYNDEKFSVVSINQNGFNVVLSQFVLKNDLACDNSLIEELKIRLLKATVGNFRNVEIRVKTIDININALEAGMKPKWTRRFRYVFAWQPDAQKYKAVINPVKQREAAYKKYSGCKEISN